MVRDYVKWALWALLVFNRGVACGQQYNDIVISEIMADPSPKVGLPEVEYLELFNRTGKPVSLKNWKLGMGARSAIFPDSIIGANSYIIVCAAGNYSVLRPYGNIIPLSSFSLPNEGGTLSLYHRNQLIYSISYALGWWNTVKRNGGYALEIIDVNNPCSGANNWDTSQNETGGTPGKLNSINRDNPDLTPPEILHVNIKSANELEVIWDEKLDSLNAVSGADIKVFGRNIIKRRLESPQFQRLILTLDTPLLANEKYNISFRNISDCSGNILRESSQFVGLPVKADSGEVVLNEILFNPPENGVDFIEIYNGADKFISLKNWMLGNTKNGEPDVFRVITTDDFILAPFSYLAVCADPEIVKQLYPTDKTRSFLAVVSLPSYPNTMGGVILKDDTDRIYDRFEYSEAMHDPLINSPQGVSLEKRDVRVSSKDLKNWHSAAVTSGNATPGYANSQIRTESGENAFHVEPEAFAPDRNSEEGVARIKYELASPGQIVTIKIYDVHGRLTKNLIQNQLIGTTGEILWDGTSDNGEMVQTGYYLILIDSFDTNGVKEQYKLKVVAVRK